jgi:outer membrane protein OmpA-like peptidoglycan-associated protein/uncharacterized protein YidB (DUF937 family)
MVQLSALASVVDY